MLNLSTVVGKVLRFETSPKEEDRGGVRRCGLHLIRYELGAELVGQPVYAIGDISEIERAE
jgi:hypothetical protein